MSFQKGKSQIAPASAQQQAYMFLREQIQAGRLSGGQRIRLGRCCSRARHQPHAGSGSRPTARYRGVADYPAEPRRRGDHVQSRPSHRTIRDARRARRLDLCARSAQLAASTRMRETNSRCSSTASIERRAIRICGSNGTRPFTTSSASARGARTCWPRCDAFGPPSSLISVCP